ncbi:MAG: hypothetical protein P4L77_10935 [Sulfuriferula sp.]|nr:hypothetical protein [Sulfuriferula sp.]
MEYVVNEMDRRLMGVNGLNFADAMDSSPRKNMFASHIGQCLVIKEGTERFIQTGMERQYAKTTFSVKMPETGTILKVIPRYHTVMGDEPIRNSETILIYEVDDPDAPNTGEIGLVRLPGYFSDQTYFGFEYRTKKITNTIRKDMRIEKGTVLLDSPAVTDNGDYKYGRECNVAYMSHPAVSEDGILVSRDILPYFAIQTFERRDVEWGSRYFPINLYGDPSRPEEYKPFPEIGDLVRPDGLLMALRRDDRSLAIVQQSARALREVDYFHDRRVYAEGAGGRIVDIKIYHDDYNTSNTPEAMERQAMRYHRTTQRFYKEIVDEIKRLETRRQGQVLLSKPLHSLAVEAYAMLDNRANGSQERRVLLHRKNPLDDWRVEFVIQYERLPDVGWKWTDCHGGKGVICAIEDPENMPVDEDGNRADIVMDGNSTNSRMNLGRLQEQYMNAASRDVRKRICARLGLDVNMPALQTKIEQLESSQPGIVDEAWNYLMGYFRIVSPERMLAWWGDRKYTPPLGKPEHWSAIDPKNKYVTWEGNTAFNACPRSAYLASIIAQPNGIILYFPPEHEVEFPDIIEQCEADPRYRPIYGPVTYTGYSGNTWLTENKVRIGSVYIIELEKIADDWTAVSSSKRQHFGVISQVTSWDKHSTPQRTNAIRAWGESEIRILVSFGGSRVTADILDRNNNPMTSRHILYNILRAPKPTDIEKVVDRSIVPYGGNKPVQLFKHMAECGGWGLEYRPYIPKNYTFNTPNVTHTPTQSEFM